MAKNVYIKEMNLCVICPGMSSNIDGGKVDPLLKSVYATVHLFAKLARAEEKKLWLVATNIMDMQFNTA